MQQLWCFSDFSFFFSSLGRKSWLVVIVRDAELTGLTAEEMSQWVTITPWGTVRRRWKTVMDAKRRRRKKTGKEQVFKKTFIRLLKLCSVTEQLTRRVDYRVHPNAKIHPGTSARVFKRDGVLHTLFPFTALLTFSAKQTASLKTLRQAINQLLSKIHLTPKFFRFIKCAEITALNILLKPSIRAFTIVVIEQQSNKLCCDNQMIIFP